MLLRFCQILFFLILLGCSSNKPIEVVYAKNVDANKAIYPDQEWIFIKPEQAHWSAEQLHAAKEIFEDIGGQSLFVVHRGYVVAAWGDFTKNVEVRSIRKSLLNALYGQLNGLDTATTLSDLNIDDQEGLSEVEKSATIKNLLTTSSGIMHPAAYTPPIRDAAKRGQLSPGERFEYNNWDFNTLASIYNQLSKSDLFKDFETQIAQPIKMQDFDLKNTKYHYEKKSNHPAYLFNISARDLARFGLLYMNGGNWKGQQLIDSIWIKESTRRHYLTPTKYKNSTNGYGYLWWTYDWRFNDKITKPAFAARGTGGQYLFVCPEMETVVVFRSEPGGWLKNITGNRVTIEESYRLLAHLLKAHPLLTK